MPDLRVPAGTIFVSRVDPFVPTSAVVALGQALAGRGRRSLATHAWLSLGGGYVVNLEHGGLGVAIEAVDPFDLTSAVTRIPPPGGPLSAMERRLLIQEATRLESASYDRVATVLALLPPRLLAARRSASPAPFCSALVAHLLAHVSRPVSARPPYSVTPADLLALRRLSP